MCKANKSREVIQRCLGISSKFYQPKLGSKHASKIYNRKSNHANLDEKLNHSNRLKDLGCILLIQDMEYPDMKWKESKK